MTNDTIGVDISKDHLDAHRMSDGESRRFANDKAGHRAFVGWAGRCGARIVYEPTGPYHRAFERRLAEAGLSPLSGIESSVSAANAASRLFSRTSARFSSARPSVSIRRSDGKGLVRKS